MSNERPYRLAGNFEGSDPLEGVPDEYREAYLESLHNHLTEEEIAIKQWEESEKADAIERLNGPLFPARSGLAFLMEDDIPIQAYVPDFIYTGALNALVGSPKAGKSTLGWAMLLAMMGGQEFLGKKTVAGRVLYISEQSDRSFGTQMKERLPKGVYERIMGHPKFSFMTPDDHWKTIDRRVDNHSEKVSVPILTWRDRLDWWKKAVKAVKPAVVVIDTFNQYAAFDSEGGENNNAEIASRMLELNELKKEHPAIGVLLLCHTNKASHSGNGKFLDLIAIRGGSAFAGAMDHVVLLNKPQTQHSQPSRERYIHIESRMTEERRFVIEWQADGTYREIPEGQSKPDAPKKVDLKQQVFEALAVNPDLVVLPVREIVKKLGEYPFQVPAGQTTVHQVLQEMKAMPSFKNLFAPKKQPSK